MNKTRVAIITNIPAPYRVDLFQYLCDQCTEYKWHFVFASKTEDNRIWSSGVSNLPNVCFLKSKTIKRKEALDDKYIHLPGNISDVLNVIKPQAVICWEYNPIALKTLFWTKTHNCKFIHLTDGTLFSERNISFLQKVSRKIIIKNADSFIASSTKAKEKLLYWGAEQTKISIALLSVNIKPYLQLKRKTISGRILYVGSMVERKGLDLLFRALVNIKTPFDLHIVGNGAAEDKERLMNLAKELNIFKSIDWCGFKEGKQLFQEYQEAQLFVLPTREDCFGLVLLEAAASGVPIISSVYADGVYDLPEGTYILVDPYDAEGFAKAIEETLLHFTNVRTIQESAFDSFHFDQIAIQFQNALKRALN